MIFLNPDFFWLFILLPFLMVFYFFRDKKNYSTIPFSIDNNGVVGVRAKLYPVLFFLRLLTSIFIIIALARPQSTELSTEVIKKQGIDIMISMDISSSMLAEDFKPNRLEVAKKLAIEFIKKRNNDRIGLVMYAGQYFTKCPLTPIHDFLIKDMESLNTDLLQDGTAIGLGLAESVRILKESKAESKIVILLTDGENNTGFIDPIMAAEIARSENIKTYIIGVGSYGTAPYPTQSKDFFGNQVYIDVEASIDENMLTEMANLTNGVYFRADNESKLVEIYDEIDKLQKSDIEERRKVVFSEKYFIFCLLAFISYLLEFLLNYTIFKRIV